MINNMQFHIVTIFPSIFSTQGAAPVSGQKAATGESSYLKESIIGRAQKNGLIEVVTHNLRDYSTERHQKVDDTPYGGGAGMVLQVEPIFRCVTMVKELIAKTKEDSLSQSSLSHLDTRVILFSAKGKKYTQGVARRLAGYGSLILICGRYEGVDERVAENIADEEISIGDYVLTGGELPAMIIIDSVSRLLPDVLGNEESAKNESHSYVGYVEHPQYSKPQEFQGWKVPEVLLSGNHKEIERWRDEYSRKK